MISPIFFTDFYKTDHRRQYPEGTSLVYSNFTPRESRIPGVESVVVFGIQYFLKDYLGRRFNQGFFDRDKEEVISEYKRVMDSSLGADAFPVEHLENLHDLGYLPIEIKALPEGSLCNLRVPFLTIVNTHPDFFWLTNFLETILSNVIWGAINSATIAFEFKKKLSEFARETSDIEDFVMWQGHDFSMRGMFGLEAALISGAAHLTSFTGTDTVPAILFLEEFYNAEGLIGGSVPATEHSVMCLGGKETEVETFERLLKLYPSGVLSIVSDTWDYWKILTETLPKLKNLIMSRNGKLVVRPDSGDPYSIICGDDNAEIGTPQSKGSIKVLEEVFGSEVNSKGYKQLDSHIGLIYGDSITLARCQSILEGLKKNGFASTNCVFGIGSYTYQYNTRDTLGMAIKSTYGEIKGEPVEIFKAPKTDNGMKNSARGLLRVEADGSLTEQITKEMEGGILETVFKDGKIIKEYSLQEIRQRLSSQL